MNCRSVLQRTAIFHSAFCIFNVALNERPSDAHRSSRAWQIGRRSSNFHSLVKMIDSESQKHRYAIAAQTPLPIARAPFSQLQCIAACIMGAAITSYESDSILLAMQKCLRLHQIDTRTRRTHVQLQGRVIFVFHLCVDFGLGGDSTARISHFTVPCTRKSNKRQTQRRTKTKNRIGMNHVHTRSAMAREIFKEKTRRENEKKTHEKIDFKWYFGQMCDLHCAAKASEIAISRQCTLP